ncbi:MAG: Fpg/Nei family DNA glycosylase, partial [Micromonosporaceae bacterium]
MPEGHVTHRLAREHRSLLGGATVRTSSPQGRFATGAARLDGTRLAATDAHGKHLFHRYEAPGGEQVWLHVHLGLYGKFAAGTGPAPPPVGQIRLLWQAERAYLELRGPTACELVTEPEKAALHARLGADPLRPDADPDAAATRVCRSRAPIGLLLMDQSVVAGVGVAYRAEVLFRAGLDPLTPGRALGAGTWAALWDDLTALMRDGAAAGRIDTV